MPIVYFFFPETNQLELEDIDHLFDKGGITGGVFSSKGGRTVERRFHQRQQEEKSGEIFEQKVKDDNDV